MHFLCLHGMGTSAAIFQSQTSAFRALLDGSQHTFEFVDAPYESAPAHGIQTFFPPPNYTFWQSIDPGDIAATHKWLLAHCARQSKPYDAVLCFSQGCAVAASMVLAHNNESSDEPLPFKGAIFICGGMPLAMLDNMNLPVSAKAWEISDLTGHQLATKANAAAAEIERLLKSGKAREASKRGLWDRTEDLAHKVLEPGTYDCHKLPDLPLTDVYGYDTTLFPSALRLDLPTVHIYGIKDPRYPASIQLAYLSNPEKRLVYDHGGGHEIPRTSKVSAEIASAVQWLEGQINCLQRMSD
ncbi:hypothetical protein M3J09_012569 [Ascochyta lentis]